MQPVEETEIADGTNLEDDLPGLPHRLQGVTLQENDELNLVVARAVQTLDSSK